MVASLTDGDGRGLKLVIECGIDDLDDAATYFVWSHSVSDARGAVEFGNLRGGVFAVYYPVEMCATAGTLDV